MVMAALGVTVLEGAVLLPSRCTLESKVQVSRSVEEYRDLIEECIKKGVQQIKSCIHFNFPRRGLIFADKYKKTSKDVENV